jgi:hypothetical protein
VCGGGLPLGRRLRGAAASTWQPLGGPSPAVVVDAHAAKSSGHLMLEDGAMFLREEQTKVLDTDQVMAAVVGYVGDEDIVAVVAAVVAVESDEWVEPAQRH